MAKKGWECKMPSKIGIVTIGQSPRIDVIPEIKELICGDIEIVEKGALDGLTLKEIQRFEPGEDDEILVTRMRNGTEVTIGQSFILSKLQEKILELDKEDVTLIALLCSGEFTRLQSEKPLIMPDKLLSGVLSSLVVNKRKLGLMVPSEGQVNHLMKVFQDLGFEVIGVGVSPYKNDIGAIGEAASKLKEAGIDLIVMDCFGYNLQMKDRVREITGKPVLLVRSLLARLLEELIT